jgi:hypothetical protein
MNFSINRPYLLLTLLFMDHCDRNICSQSYCFIKNMITCELSSCSIIVYRVSYNQDILFLPFNISQKMRYPDVTQHYFGLRARMGNLLC